MDRDKPKNLSVASTRYAAAISREKKTATLIQQEITHELEHLLRLIFSQRGKTGRLDWEAIEMAIRSAMHPAGAAALTERLKFDPPGPDQRELPCPCGHTAHYVELRSKAVLTVVGDAEGLRPYYLCDRCHRGQFPIDGELDIENTELSPGVRRMLATVGQQAALEQGRQPMELLAGLSVTTKAGERTAEAIGADIERRQQRELAPARQLNLPIPLGPRIPILYVEMDGTGVPVVRKETEGRAGKRDGQPAQTREAKLGCVFTQTTVNEEGYPVRDEDSTTYGGAIETAEEFGRRLYAEAGRRGWGRAEKKVVRGDGAEWVWNQADLHFPEATQIVDLYHGREHLGVVARQLYPDDVPAQRRWRMVEQDQLDHGQIEKLVASLHALECSHPGLAETLQREANYFEQNKERMRYPAFRRQGFFVGSGVVEAGCKTVVGRLKQSGMFWTVRGANAIIALRCCQLSGKFEDYWDARRARA
jgi:hypothetical protein